MALLEKGKVEYPFSTFRPASLLSLQFQTSSPTVPVIMQWAPSKVKKCQRCMNIMSMLHSSHSSSDSHLSLGLRAVTFCSRRTSYSLDQLNFKSYFIIDEMHS